MFDDSFLKSSRSRFRAAMVLAIAADAVQILIFPLFAEGAISPLDDILAKTLRFVEIFPTTNCRCRLRATSPHRRNVPVPQVSMSHADAHIL